MDFAYEQAGSVLIVKLAGQLDASAAQLADKRFGELLTGGTPRVAIDMSELDYISSAGLRVLLVFAKKVGQSHGKVALFDLVPVVRNVFTVSGFDKIFPIHAESSAAIAAVANESP
jgi:anti-anti-sigma factor